MSNLLLFLFTTLVDFVILLLLLRVFSSFWVSTNNQIHQSIILMTNSILNPLRSNLNNKTFIYVVLCVCLLIKFFTLWLMTKFACLIGPNFFQLVGLSIFSLLRFVLNILFFTIIIHAVFSWILNNQHNSFSDFIRQLVVPILHPIQKRLPYPAGMDFSPFIAIVVIQSINLIIPFSEFTDNIVCMNLAQIL
ncbi:MAG: YggT family protein [Gammaproteobacteria bacterium]|jgi:YggT family protein